LAESERARLVIAGHRLTSGGLVTGTSGNLSMRIGAGVLVTGSGTSLGSLTESDLTLVSADGAVLDGDLPPTSELPLHLAVYAAFPEVGAIAHAHSPASVAVGLTHDVLPPAHYLTVRLGGVVRVADYATFGSPELAAAVVDGLAGRSAVLMRAHGSVAHGAGIEQACDRLELVEWLADVYSRAAALGAPRLLSAAELAEADAMFTRLDYGAGSYTRGC
jgi:L-fuculose-phosphate aldolase